MSERKKTVAIIEDEKFQRERIENNLARYGFNTLSGATITDTLELLKKHRDDLAVIILDMDLTGFPDYLKYAQREGQVTGVELATKLLGESPRRRPEIIILSAFDRVEYYQRAIEGGASAYMVKGLVTNRFVPSVQALALRYSFQSSPANDAEVARLAEGHANGFELLSYFCQNKLARELDLCLARASYALLYRFKGDEAEGPEGGGQTVSVYSDVADLPAAGEFDYTSLHRAIFEAGARPSAYTPAAETLGQGRGERLKDFTFVRLVDTAGAEVALGVLNAFPVEDELGDYPFTAQAQASALVKHAAPALDSFVARLMLRWRENQNVKLERLRTFAGLSGSIQRRLAALLRDEAPKTAEEGAEHFERLRRFSRELNDYGRTLSALLDAGRAAAGRPRGDATRLSELVQELRAEYDRLGYFDDVTFEVEADCAVPADRYYFSLALRELTKWAVERREEVPRGEKQRIRLRCAHVGDWTEIYFMESSERLSTRVRESYLFEPLSSLHAARSIIEVACQGKLLDATEESQADTGHLLKLRLLHG